jgi:two-component system sensor histidine kinase BaeS
VSFRLRVLALVALVAVTATSLTAWLTLQQASRQVTESADAERADIEAITGELTGYGRTHGTWEGVANLVRELGRRTGQRIQLLTEYGEVIVDTDTLAGRTARPVDSPPILVNPRPTLTLPTGRADVATLVGITLGEIASYRAGVRFAACLTRRGAEVTVVDGRYGVPRYLPGLAGPPPDPAVVEECRRLAGEAAPGAGDVAAAEQCLAVADGAAWPFGAVSPFGTASPGASPDPTPPSRGVKPVEPSSPSAGSSPTGGLAGCLPQVFARRVADVAPVPLYVHLGAVDDTGPAVSAGPVLAAAALVAVLAIAGSLLLSRRVLRPIRALTSASRRLGAGDLSERVPVVGRDELAGLARSFNRMADSLQRGEERQRRLVADVAHELRTPLANLRGYLEALKDGVVAPDPELFASLHEEAVLQQRIVDDLQDLALAEAGTLVYHRSRVDLVELLEVCRTAHQAVAETAGVRLTATGDGPVPVHADPDRLRQVLGNLVGNALRATPAGGAVTLAAVRAGAWATVTVADTGTGIAPEHLPYVFDRFWRGDPARGRTTGGSGLGLAIARQIVTDHGGVITVASTPGTGTTFTIRLPVDESAPDPPAAAR